MLTQQPIRFAHYLPTDKTCQLANNKAGALFVYVVKDQLKSTVFVYNDKAETD